MITVKINNIDKTSLINWKSFNIVYALTKEVDVLSFSIKGKTYKPQLSDEVEVFDGATKIYGGIVIEVNESVAGLLPTVNITCKDYTHLLDRILVYKNYAKNRTSNLNAEDIVKDIISNFTSGFTTANVNAPVKIESMNFNYDQVSKAIQAIAQQIDYDWYIDENKDIHFFSKEENLAPIELNDNDGNFVWGSLVIDTNISQIKNSIIVRGGEKTDAKDWAQKVADGKQTMFQLGYSYNPDATFQVEVSTDGGSNWTPLSEGRDGVDDPADHDINYNPTSMVIIFREDNKPGAGHIVRWKGSIIYPIIISRESNESVGKYGKFQFRELDKSIKSLEEAQQRAAAIISKYGDAVHEGKFTTYHSGLRVGQKIKIDSTIRGISGYFNITKIMTKIRNPETGELQHDVSFVGSEVNGILDIFTKLLSTDPSKNIAFMPNEIIDLLYVLNEILELQDTAEILPKTSPPYMWMPDSPSDDAATIAANPGKTPMIWDFFTWSS